MPAEHEEWCPCPDRCLRTFDQVQARIRLLERLFTVPDRNTRRLLQGLRRRASVLWAHERSVLDALSAGEA
jgi:hypothetical protein